MKQRINITIREEFLTILKNHEIVLSKLIDNLLLEKLADVDNQLLREAILIKRNHDAIKIMSQGNIGRFCHDNQIGKQLLVRANLELLGFYQEKYSKDNEMLMVIRNEEIKLKAMERGGMR